MIIFAGNNCQLPRSRPYVSVLMEFPTVSSSNNNNGHSNNINNGHSNINGHSNTKFWSSLASHSPLRPRSLVSEHNGFHHNGVVTSANGHARQPPTEMCALCACVVSCARVILESARGHRAPSRVYGISSDTLSSDNRFQEDSERPSAPQAPRESPPYLPSEPQRQLNGHQANGTSTVRDLPV